MQLYAGILGLVLEINGRILGVRVDDFGYCKLAWQSARLQALRQRWEVVGGGRAFTPYGVFPRCTMRLVVWKKRSTVGSQDCCISWLCMRGVGVPRDGRPCSCSERPVLWWSSERVRVWIQGRRVGEGSNWHAHASNGYCGACTADAIAAVIELEPLTAAGSTTVRDERALSMLMFWSGWGMAIGGLDWFQQGTSSSLSAFYPALTVRCEVAYSGIVSSRLSPMR